MPRRAKIKAWFRRRSHSYGKNSQCRDWFGEVRRVPGEVFQQPARSHFICGDTDHFQQVRQTTAGSRSIEMGMGSNFSYTFTCRRILLIAAISTHAKQAWFCCLSAVMLSLVVLSGIAQTGDSNQYPTWWTDYRNDELAEHYYCGRGSFLLTNPTGPDADQRIEYAKTEAESGAFRDLHTWLFRNIRMTALEYAQEYAGEMEPTQILKVAKTISQYFVEQATLVCVEQLPRAKGDILFFARIQVDAKDIPEQVVTRLISELGENNTTTELVRVWSTNLQVRFSPPEPGSDQIVTAERSGSSGGTDNVAQDDPTVTGSTDIFSSDGLSGSSTAERSTVDGVVYVNNNNTPPIQHIELEEMWRTGGGGDFGTIIDVKFDEAHNVYLLDKTNSEVTVYSLDGSRLRTFGRAGDGPGELKHPLAIVLLDNNNIGVASGGRGKMVMLKSDGSPNGTIVPHISNTSSDGFTIVRKCWSAQGEVVFLTLTGYTKESPIRREFTVASYNMDGNSQIVFGSDSHTLDRDNMVMREADAKNQFYGMTVSSDGKVIIPRERNGYVINVYQLDGQLELVFGREYTPCRRDQERLDYVTRRYQGAASNLLVDIAEYESDISSIHVDHNGNYWIHNSRQNWISTPDVFAYDVFNNRGELVREAAIDCEGVAAKDKLFLSGDGYVIKVTGQLEAVYPPMRSAEYDRGDEYMYVTCYRMI